MGDFANVEDEIRRLHDFFVSWFNGRVPKEDAVFAEVRDALHPRFALISPRAVVDRRDVLLDSIWAAHGAHQDFAIWIENATVRHVDGALAIATYEEWQQRGAAPPRGRLSTVVFVQVDSRLQWLHVHETFLPDGP